MPSPIRARATPATTMSTEHSNAEIAGSNGRTTNPDGESEVPDEPGEDASPLVSALRTVLGRVVSAIRESGAALPQTGNPSAEAPLFGDCEKVEEAKYSSPAPLSRGDERKLPESPGRPGVTLMAVDPYLIHAYWDFDPAALPPDTTAAALRIHDAEAHFDVEVDLRTKSWYVPLWSPAKTYYADLGAVTVSGEFIPLSRSNIIQTSRAWPVAEAERRWVSVAPPSPPCGASPDFPEPVPPWMPALDSEPAASMPSDCVPAPAPSGPASDQSRNPDQSRDRQGADSGYLGEFITSSARPPDAAEVLRSRLAELYALRQWPPQGRETRPPFRQVDPLNAGPEARSPAAQTAPLRALPGQPDDLTTHADRQFAPGLSSLLLGTHGSKRRPG